MKTNLTFFFGLLASALSLQSSRADCVSAPSGLIAWWRAENSALDQVSTNHGILLNGDTFAAGLVGQAFSFNASSNAGVVVPSTPALNPTGAITIEAWVKPSSFPNPGPTIVRKDLNSGGTPQYGLLIGDGITSGVVHFNIGGIAFVTGGSVPSNVWTHVAGTYDRQFIRIYVNGVEVTNAPATAAIPVSSENLSIGKEELFTVRNFDGLIDEVSLYNRALNSNEIAAIFNAGSAGKCVTPSLTISLTTTNTAVVSWPSPSTDFGLQQNTNSVSSVNWSNVALTPADNGTNKFIIVDPPTGNRFYRLFKP